MVSARSKTKIRVFEDSDQKSTRDVFDFFKKPKEIEAVGLVVMIEGSI